MQPTQRLIFIALGMLLIGYLFSESVFKAHTKTRKTEARVLLGELADLEEKFMEVHGRYSLDLLELTHMNVESLFQPGVFRYSIGFFGRCPRTELPTGDVTHSMDPKLDLKFLQVSAQRAAEIEEVFLQDPTEERCPDLKKGYRAIAVGPLNETGKLDVWLVDESKVVVPAK